jgi:hypothetical protein
MAEVKGRVVAVWCHAEWPRLFCGRFDFPQFIPHNANLVALNLAAQLSDGQEVYVLVNGEIPPTICNRC